MENTYVHWQAITRATCLGLTRKNVPNYGIPEVQELATGRMGTKVGAPTLRAAEMPTVDLHVLRDGATTLLASWCEALRHNGRRPSSARTESATII
jgi:hypothetical protein